MKDFLKAEDSFEDNGLFYNNLENIRKELQPFINKDLEEKYPEKGNK